MIKRILIGFGNSATIPAEIEHAVELARFHGAQVTALTSVEVGDHRAAAANPASPLSAAGWARELAHEQHEIVCEETANAVECFREACEQAGIKYGVQTLGTKPFEEIVALSRYFDLFVCSAKRIFESSILDANSDALVRLVANGVRPILAVQDEFQPIRRVLVAYTGSVDSAKTMKKFIQSQLWPVLSLRVVAIEQSEHESRRLLNDAADYCRAHGYEPEVGCLAANGSHELLQHAADWKADAIVVGNSDRGVLSRLVFRDTSLDIIRDAGCALFLAQ